MPAIAPPVTPFGEEIRNRRVELGLTAGQVADHVGVHQTTISRWERGKGLRTIKATEIELLAEVLQLQADVLRDTWADTLRDPSFPGLRNRHPQAA